MPILQQAQQLKDFVEEVFSTTKEFLVAQAAQSKARQDVELTQTEFLALDVLARSEGTPTVGDVQRQIGVLPAQMSRIIRSLESKGEQPLIECRINTHDKRKVDLAMTEAGREAYSRQRRVKLGAIEKMLLDLTDQDRAEFMRILRQIRESMAKSRLCNS